MALIKRIVTGQTFGNWLDTTNKLIDDLNAANPTRGGNRLVRYDNFGNLSIRDIQANSFFLDTDTSVKIDTLSTDYTVAGHENNNTIFTAAATYAAIKAEAKNIIKNAGGHTVSSEYIEIVDPTPGSTVYPAIAPSSLTEPIVRTVLGRTELIRTTSTETKFNQNVIIDGDLSVLGDSVELTTETLQVQDNNLVLNTGGNSASAERAGFDVFATTAHLRLVNSGNRFPWSSKQGTSEPKNIRIKLYESNEIRNYFISKIPGDSDVPQETYAQGEYLSGNFQDLRKLFINQKDSLVFEYRLDSANITSNTIPFAIGTSAGSAREASVLEPDPSNPGSTANSEIIYNIDGVDYNSYEEYKNEFLSKDVWDGVSPITVVKVTFSPKNYTQPGHKYFYWSGTVNSYSYVAKTNYLQSPTVQKIESDIFTDGAFTTGNAKNNDYLLALGDQLTFTIDYASLNTIDGQKEPILIGTLPFNATDPTHTTPHEVRLDINKLVFKQNGSPFPYDIKYELNDVEYAGGANRELTDYIQNFRAGIDASGVGGNPIVTANVIFTPNNLAIASQYDFYYFNAANNQNTFSGTNYDFGGRINVTANNTGMGEEINVIYPMGQELTEIMTETVASATNLDIGGVTNGERPINAGDTLVLDCNNLSEALQIQKDNGFGLWIDLNYKDHGIRYEVDGNFYELWSEFNNHFTTRASSASIHFTPTEVLQNSTVKYKTASRDGGDIVIQPTKSRKLDAWYLKTDDTAPLGGGDAGDGSARIENPIGFNITKNHNHLLKMDGITADFSGTQSGLRLPIESIPRTPPHPAAANGTIRYNAGTNLFEGYTNGTWRGLGGVIDLNQDTEIKAHDSDDILHFYTNGFNLSNMQEDQYFLYSKTDTTGSESGQVKVESNIDRGKYTIWTESNQGTSAHFNDAITSSEFTKLTVQPNGVKVDSKGFFKLPVGTHAERPTLPEHGMLRMNRDALQLNDTNSASLTNVGSSDRVDALEYWDETEGDWITLSHVKNEFVQELSATHSGPDVTFKMILRPFVKHELEVYINGIRIPRSDISSITSVPNSPGSDFSDCTITFSSARSPRQVITVIQSPKRYVGETHFGFLSKAEFLSGLSDPVNFAGPFQISSTVKASSITDAALVVSGGIGLSHDAIVGGSVIELSALALKENIKPIESALDKVKQLNGVEFTWKDEKKQNSQQLSEYGLIAENVASVVPNLASFENNKASGVKYSKVVALLIEAVKQQQEEIDILKQQLPKKRTRKSSSTQK